MKLFAVIRTRGTAFNAASTLEDQKEWPAHARFMNGLAADGVIVLGGPLEGTSEVLLVMRANSAEEITTRLEADPWTALDLLRVLRITPWTLRLGSLPTNQPK